MAGILTWIANQTRTDISNAVRAIARFSSEPQLAHHKAARKIPEYLNATSDVDLTIKKSSELGCT